MIAAVGILLIAASAINGSSANLSGQMFNDANGIFGSIFKVALITPFFFIGKILILSIVMAVLFYSLVVLAVGYMMSPADIIASEEGSGLVTADAMAKAFNSSIMAKVLIIGGMCGIVTSWNSFLMGGSRAMYSMAESYMIPKMFGKLHPKYKTPVNALFLVGALTVLAPFAGRKMLVWIVDAGNFGCCLAYCLVSVSFLILRKKEPDMERPYKVKHYLFVGVMAVLMSGFMVVCYMVPASGSALVWQEWLMAGGWCVLGVIFFAISKWKYKEKFGILINIISDEDALALQASDSAIGEALDKAIDEAIALALKNRGVAL